MNPRTSLRRRSPLKWKDHFDTVKFVVRPNVKNIELPWQIQVRSRSSEMAEWFNEGQIESTGLELHRYLSNVRYQYYILTPSFIKKQSFIRIDNVFLGIKSYDYDTKVMKVVNLTAGYQYEQDIDLLELLSKIDHHTVKFFDTLSIVQFYSDAENESTVFAIGSNVMQYPEAQRLFRTINSEALEATPTIMPWSLFVANQRESDDDEFSEIFEELNISGLHVLNLEEVKL